MPLRDLTSLAFGKLDPQRLLGKKITPSPSARDLGLQVDSILSYDEHVTQTVSSCIGSLCQINRV